MKDFKFPAHIFEQDTIIKRQIDTNRRAKFIVYIVIGEAEDKSKRNLLIKHGDKMGGWVHAKVNTQGILAFKLQC
jgi:hypothetical protein